MRLDGCSKLHFGIIRNVKTKQRNHKETQEGMKSVSSKETSSSNVSKGSVRMESRPCSKAATAWSIKE